MAEIMRAQLTVGPNMTESAAEVITISEQFTALT